MSENDVTKIIKIIIDAFDVDIQLYTAKVLKRLRQSDVGFHFAEWAESNPVVFESSLRVFSTAIQQLPKNGSIAMETLSDHLRRFPVELRRATIEDVNDVIEEPSLKNDVHGKFKKNYEEAVASISEEERLIVASLSHNRLVHWVNSPEAIRSALLSHWVIKDQRLFKIIEDLEIGSKKAGKFVSNNIKSVLKRIDDSVPEVDDPGFFKGVFSSIRLLFK